MSVSKNYLLNVLMTITGILFPMITFPYVSRVLMPEYIGKVTFAQSIVFYFTTLALLGIPIYGIRELSKTKKEPEEFKRIFTELLIIGIIGSLVSFGLIFLVINFNSKLQEVKSLIYIFSIQVICSFLNLDYIFIVLEKHKRRAIRALLLRIISIVLMLTFVKSYEDYKIYAGILVVPEVITRILDLISVKEYIVLKNSLKLKRHMKSLLILFVSSLSVSLYVSLDSTMLGLIEGDSSVGLYASASKMTKVLIPLIIALETVIAPELIRYIKENKKEKVFEKVDMFLDFNFFLGIQFIFIMFLLSKDMILLFSGEKFISADLAMKIMLPVIFFIPVGSFMSGKILISHNLEKLSLNFNIIAMISNATLNYLLIPKYGIAGAGFATMFTEGLNCVLKTLRVKKIYPDYRVLTKDRLKYILIGSILTLLLLGIKIKYVNYNLFYNILIIGSLYSILYLIALYIFKDKIIIDLSKIIEGKINNVRKEK